MTAEIGIPYRIQIAKAFETASGLESKLGELEKCVDALVQKVIPFLNEEVEIPEKYKKSFKEYREQTIAFSTSVSQLQLGVESVLKVAHLLKTDSLDKISPDDYETCRPGEPLDKTPDTWLIIFETELARKQSLIKKHSQLNSTLNRIQSRTQDVTIAMDVIEEAAKSEELFQAYKTKYSTFKQGSVQFERQQQFAGEMKEDIPNYQITFDRLKDTIKKASQENRGKIEVFTQACIRRWVDSLSKWAEELESTVKPAHSPLSPNSKRKSLFQIITRRDSKTS